MNKKSSKMVSMVYVIASTTLVLALWFNNYQSTPSQQVKVNEKKIGHSQTDSLNNEEFWQDAQFMKD